MPAVEELGCEELDLTAGAPDSRYPGLYLSLGDGRPGEVGLGIVVGDSAESDGWTNGAGLTVNSGRTSALESARRRPEYPGLKDED